MTKKEIKEALEHRYNYLKVKSIKYNKSSCLYEVSINMIKKFSERDLDGYLQQYNMIKDGKTTRN